MVPAHPCPLGRGRADQECVAGYVRVSTTDQAENGLSLPIQRDAIRAYCEKNAVTLTKIFEDPGRSGASIENRPGLQELLADAKQRKFKKVIVTRLDRLARDLYIQLWLEKELLVHGIEVISITEPCNGNQPTTKLLRSIIGAFAELERQTIRDRLLSGRRKRLSMGLYTGGACPLGYRLTENSELVIEPKGAETVRLCFKLRAQGLTYKKIAEKLNHAGIKPPAGKLWYPGTTHYICNNKTYQGMVRYGETKPGTHKPIIRCEKGGR